MPFILDTLRNVLRGDLGGRLGGLVETSRCEPRSAIAALPPQQSGAVLNNRYYTLDVAIGPRTR